VFVGYSSVFLPGAYRDYACVDCKAYTAYKGAYRDCACVDCEAYTVDKNSRFLACKQALRGDLAAGQEKEGELVTTSLEFEFLHRKSRCNMLIGGDLIW